MHRLYTDGFVSKHHGTWRANLDYTDETGRRRRVTKATGVRCYDDVIDPSDGSIIKRDNRGKGQAELVLREWRRKLVESEESSPGATDKGPARVTAESPLYDYAKAYLDRHIAKESTITGYKAALKRLRGTEAGSTPIARLSAWEIKSWEAGMYEDGLSQTTVAHYHAFVAQVLKYALAVNDIQKNPLGAMKAPRRKRKPVNSLLPQAARAVSEVLDALGPTPLSMGARLALTCGMRRGEICALRWLDVDFDNRIIHVVHGLTKDNGFKLDTPKDPDGGDVTRDIPIGDGLMACLRSRKRHMQDQLLEFGVKWSDTNFVIGNPLTGSFKSPDAFGKEWSILSHLKDWTGTQGEVVTLHDLRHTFATLSVANHMDIMCLAAILGHRDPSITLSIYAVALEEPKRAGMERMDELFFRAA